MNQRSSLRWQVTLLVTAVFLVVMAAFSGIIYYDVRNTTVSQMTMQAQGITESLCDMILNNVEPYLELTETLDTASPFYEELCGYFREIKTANGILYMHSERQVDGDTIQYILNAELPGSEFFSPLGSYDAMTDARALAYERAASVHSGLVYNAKRGYNISVFSPIIRPDTGELLGLVGADINIDDINDKMMRMVLLFVVTVGLMVLILFFVVYYMSGTIIGPMTVDSLTEVYNRRYFDKFLKRQMHMLRNRSMPLSVMMLDLDLFKHVNDSYGHPFGDLVLKQTAHLIGLSLRKTDCLARYGGEEFIVALPFASASETQTIAERIRQTIEQNGIYYDEGDIYIHITISIGVAEMDASISAAALVEKADKALYKAKVTRNTVVALWPMDTG